MLFAAAKVSNKTRNARAPRGGYARAPKGCRARRRSFASPSEQTLQPVGELPPAPRRTSSNPSANFLQPLGELPPAHRRTSSSLLEQKLCRVRVFSLTRQRIFSDPTEKILHPDGAIPLTGCRILFFLALPYFFYLEAHGKIGQHSVRIGALGLVSVCCSFRPNQSGGTHESIKTFTLIPL